MRPHLKYASTSWAPKATTWDKQNEALLATYNAVMRPHLSYISTSWPPKASYTNKQTSLGLLQDAQEETTYNICMMHMHDEAQTLSLTEHLNYLSHKSNKNYYTYTTHFKR